MLIYDLTKEEINEFLLRNGHKKYRTDQVWDWVYKKKVKNFSDMKNIPKDIIDLLSENFHFNALELVLKEESSDGTIKFLYGLQDKNLIETVLMTHSYGKSVCVTTQVGCNIGCSFCASGVLRKKRDLTAGEIIAQIIDSEILFGERISHIVVMGIGEPFDNYNNLLKFLRTVNDPQGLEIGARHITVSTSGLANKIKEFAEFELQVNLALSLHAPNNEIRSQLMKINKAYPIEKVLESIDYYIEKTNRRVTIEYILIHDLNDSVATAMELARLLRGMNVYVNLIPYNEVIEAGYKRSSRQNQFAFFDALKKSGINCTLRKEQGHDINAACGQLRSTQEAKEL